MEHATAFQPITSIIVRLAKHFFTSSYQTFSVVSKDEVNNRETIQKAEDESLVCLDGQYQRHPHCKANRTGKKDLILSFFHSKLSPGKPPGKTYRRAAIGTIPGTIRRHLRRWVQTKYYRQISTNGMHRKVAEDVLKCIYKACCGSVWYL